MQHLFFLFALLLPLCSANPIFHLCAQNVTKNATWIENSSIGLKTILAKTPSNGYTITVVGNGSEAFYGLAQCRGDINSVVCYYCINDVIKELQEICPASESARMWFDKCFIRFETTNFFGSVDVTNANGLSSINETEYPEAHKAAVWPLMIWVKSVAADKSNKFGIGKRSFVISGQDMTTYGMAQCTPDLDRNACTRCLDKMLDLMEVYCGNKLSCSLRCSSCAAMFDYYNFLRTKDVPDYHFSSAPSPSPIAVPA